MDSTETKPSGQILSRTSFSIKNILNLQEEETAAAVELQEVLHTNLKDTRYPVPASFTPSCAMGQSFLYPCIYGLPAPAHYMTTNWANLNFEQHFSPGWVYNTRFMRQEFFPGYAPCLNARRQRRFTRKKKQRPLFSQQQVQTMEEEFTKHRYVNENKRAELATELGLTETQIKTWFQNRRTKWRKEIRDEVATKVAKTQKRWHETLSGASSSNTASEFYHPRNVLDV